MVFFRSLFLLAVLAGCQAAAASQPSPVPKVTLQQIAALFQQTPINTELLERILEIREGDLRLIVPDVAPATFWGELGEWVLENTGARPLVLPRAACVVRIDYEDFLIRGGRCYSTGGRLLEEPRRPVFTPEHWMILEPGERLPLPSPYVRWGPCELEATVSIRREGSWFCRLAEDFNLGKAREFPPELGMPAVYKSVRQIVLPGPNWSEKLWAGQHSASVSSDDFGGFTWSAFMVAGYDREQALPLEAYVADAEGAIRYSGLLHAVSHLTTWIDPPVGGGKGTLLVVTRYTIPQLLPAGEYRLLTRARNAWTFFYEGWAYIPLCTEENQYTAVGRWTTIQIR